jgi:predicted DNA-binding transcriptional regulator YafY
MATVDALERITNLVALLLHTPAPLTLEQIGNELVGQYPAGDAALRGAFERDKAVLRDVGVPLETEVLGGNEAGKTAYRIDRRRYELAELELADDERKALQLAVAAGRLGEGRFGLLKLGVDGVDTTAVLANIPDLPALPVLREAASGRASVSFTYHDKQRTLDPYALLLREGFWYVIGRDHGTDAQRVYRVDRIESDVSTGPAGQFVRPADFDARTAMPADARQIGGDPHATAVVRIRRASGSDDIEVPCGNLPAFRSWLFGLGTRAEVLSPPEVRADVIAWLDAMVAQ